MRLVYVHGINQINTDPVSAKQAWDLDLFGRENPNSRLVYWGDLSVVQQMKMGLSFSDLMLCEILKLGTANALLKDVHNYFYEDYVRIEVLRRFTRALPEDPTEPCVVIGHSQGSVIAYDGLIQAEIHHNCKSFITMGSPLGLHTVMAELRRFNNLSSLPVPKQIKKWNNYRDRLDPVALQKTLKGNYTGAISPEDDFVTNIDDHINPHSLPGYLKTRAVRNSVAEAILL